MTQGRAMTGEQQERFLAHLRASANVSSSAAVIGWSRSGVYGARDRDTAFAEAWADAIEEATDALEAEARRRALEGTEE